ncbi:MAG: phage holin family protein [Bacteroidota bacterium]
MKLLSKLLLSTLAVFVLAYLLPGIYLDGWKSALLAAIVLGILNHIVAPILKFLSIPITVITLGLFLLVINASMVMLTAHFVNGFAVNGWLWALIFALALSFLQSILYKSFLSRKEKS